MAFLIQDDEHLPLSHSWSFWSHAILLKVHFHFMLKSCTCFHLVQRRKHGYVWIFFFFFFTYFGKVKIEHCLNEGRDYKQEQSAWQNEMTVKALRPKQAYFRAYRTCSNHEESMFWFRILLFVFFYDFILIAPSMLVPLTKEEVEPPSGTSSSSSRHIIDQGSTQLIDKGATCVIDSSPGGSEKRFQEVL